MAYPIYECPENLPERIPAILQGRGMAVRPIQAQGRECPPKPEPEYFEYEVDRGLAGASVFGGMQDGKTYFHIAWRGGWRMILPWLSWRLNRDIRSALFDNGAKHVDWEQEKSDSPDAARAGRSAPEDRKMDIENAVVVRTCPTRQSAEMVALELKSCGIETSIRSDDAGGALPFLDVMSGISILVERSRLEEAKSILDEMGRPREPKSGADVG